jgi:hypothetical protein
MSYSIMKPINHCSVGDVVLNNREDGGASQLKNPSHFGRIGSMVDVNGEVRCAGGMVTRGEGMIATQKDKMFDHSMVHQRKKRKPDATEWESIIDISKNDATDGQDDRENKSEGVNVFVCGPDPSKPNIGGRKICQTDMDDLQDQKGKITGDVVDGYFNLLSSAHYGNGVRTFPCDYTFFSNKSFETSFRDCHYPKFDWDKANIVLIPVLREVSENVGEYAFMLLVVDLTKAHHPYITLFDSNSDKNSLEFVVATENWLKSIFKNTVVAPPGSKWIRAQSPIQAGNDCGPWTCATAAAYVKYALKGLDKKQMNSVNIPHKNAGLFLSSATRNIGQEIRRHMHMAIMTGSIDMEDELFDMFRIDYY